MAKQREGMRARTVEAPLEIMSEIERLAEESGRSVNREIVQALKAWIRARRNGDSPAGDEK
jgi:predicted transcriptional regulator